VGSALNEADGPERQARRPGARRSTSFAQPAHHPPPEADVSRSQLDCLRTSWRERARRGQAADGTADADMRVREAEHTWGRRQGREAQEWAQNAVSMAGRRLRRRRTAYAHARGEKGREKRRRTAGASFVLPSSLSLVPHSPLPFLLGTAAHASEMHEITEERTPEWPLMRPSMGSRPSIVVRPASHARAHAHLLSGPESSTLQSP
jgi:hypothetical protein